MAVGTAICPTCGKSFSIDSSMVGQHVACPWCGEEIYMEGVDAPLEVDVPMGIPRQFPSATNTATENIPRNDTSRLSKPSDAAAATAAVPLFDTDGNTARLILGQPLKIVVLVSVVVVAVVAGCWMALRRGPRNDGEDEPAPSEIHYFAENRDAPIESQADGGDEPAAAKEEVEEESGNMQPDDQTQDGVRQDPPVATQADGGSQDMPVAMQPDETNLSRQALVPESSSISAEAEDEETDPFEEAERENEKEAADGDGADVAAPALDASQLIDAYGASGIDSYKCKTFVRDFAKTIAAANTNATVKRADLNMKVRVYLKAQMEKAQAAGNLSQVLAYQTALESARRGKIIGEDATIRKLRESYAKQLALTDNALLSEGRNAARALHASFGYQKVEATKKGEIDKATRIEAFQKEIEEWTKKMLKQMPRAVKESQVKPDRPVSKPRQNATVDEVIETKIVTVEARSARGMPIGDVAAGDTIEIQYLEGEWHAGYQTENPDAQELNYKINRCVLCKRSNPRQVFAVIPPNTKTIPFRYAVEEDADFALRVYDGGLDYVERQFSDNFGQVRYVIRVIRGKGTITTIGARQTQQAQSPVLLSKTVTVDARDGNGATIGFVRRGDTIEFKYEGGKWSYDSRSRPRESPDAKAVSSEEQRCVIVKRYDPEVVLAILPSDTQYHPYSYVAGESGELALRMYDGRDRYRRYDTGHFNDNGGSARYSVKIIPSSSADSSSRRTADVASASDAYKRTMPVESAFTNFKDGLALWYDFGDTASLNGDRTLVSDKSNGGNNGEVTGAIWKVGENGNGCFYFDGLPGGGRNTAPDEIHDFIRVTDSSLGFPLTDFTISVVCNPRNDGAIIGSGQNELWNREWNLTCDKFTWSWTRGYSSGAVGKEGYSLSFQSCMNVCSHIVVKREDNVVSVYCNGVLQGLTSRFPNQPLPIYSYGLFIGDEERDEFSTWRQWVCMRGEIYQVLIWRRALSEEETDALYSNARSRFGIRGNR